MGDTITKAALYLRVSTDKQDTDMQRQECAAYALHHNLPIVSTVTDTITGATYWRERKLGNLVHEVPGLTDVIVYEHSRIGRDMVDALEFIRYCNEAGISVHVAKSKTVIRADIGGKVLSTVMALAAEIERDMLRSRTKDGLKNIKRTIDETGSYTTRKGNTITRLGRPAGTGGSTKLDDKKADLEKLFQAGVSDAAIARMFDCDRRTVAKFKKQIRKGIK